MKRTEFFHFRYILDPRLMTAAEALTEGKKIRTTEEISKMFTDHAYVLRRSNWTAKARGGVMVAAFLAKETDKGLQIITDQAGDPSADKIVWVVRRCSEMENYNRRDSREKALFLAQGKLSLVSGNYEYPVVKKIALKLMELSEHNYKHSYQKMQIWKTLKSNFNIDEWVANGFKEVDVTVEVPVLSMEAGLSQ